MSDILSQQEIDSLLNSYASGEIEEEKLSQPESKKGYKVYDFRHPNKFSKDQLRTLRMLHESFTRIISSFLSGYLRADISIEIATVEQVTFEDFVRSVPTPTILTSFKVEPLKGVAVMETNPNFVYPIIDLFLGGMGEVQPEVRDFTDIELTIAKRLVGKVLDNLATSWMNSYELVPVINSIDTNPRLNPVMSINEMVAVLAFNTRVADSQGIINLCYPYAVLDPVMSKLAVSGALNQDAEDFSVSIMEHWLGFAELPIKVLMGENTITIRDLLHFQKGDVIPLNKNTSQDMEILVGNKLKFKGQAGTLGHKKAVQITALAGGVD